MAMFGPLGGMFGSMGGKKPGAFDKKPGGFGFGGGGGQGRPHRGDGFGPRPSRGFGGQPQHGGFDMKMDRKRNMMADALDRPDFGMNRDAPGWQGGTQIGQPDRGGGIVGGLGGGPTSGYRGGTQVGALDRGGSVVQPRDAMPVRTPMTMDQKLGMNPAYTGAPAPRDSTIGGRPSGGMPVKSKIRKNFDGVRGPSTPAGAVPTAFGGLTGYK